MKDHFENPKIELADNLIKGKVSWRSPSNIAFVKYWGKYGIQLPKNASLSMTLSKAFTQTSIEFNSSKSTPIRKFVFEGKSNENFSKRIWKFIDSLDQEFPFLKKMDLQIESENSFPHSAGIASSASSMSALALCLVDMEKTITGISISDEEFYQKASRIARLGSGSAARSLFGGFSIWGKMDIQNLNTTNDFAIGFNKDIHPHFQQLQDAILIVDEGQKQVSSSLGHSLMNGHPYAENRLLQANKNIEELSQVLKTGDQESFIRILESEALSLHALMMSSDPWFILMKAETLKIIEEIKSYRERTGKFISFTLDAGPNVHLIYSKQDEIDIKDFIEQKLKSYCSGKRIIFDEMGKGPEKLM